MAQRLVLEPIPGRFAVCRLPADAAIPQWAIAPPPGLISITRTADELSIVASEELVDTLNPPPRVERDFIAWRIAGTLDFSQVGVLAKLSGALADAGVPVFVISTFDTDIILIRAEHAARASAVLSHVGHVAPSAPR